MAEKVRLDSFFDHNDKLPQKIDHYVIKKSLGVGGMGEVFLAYDPHCERMVALKQISPRLLSHPIIRKRFTKEARFASKLTHPNIIPIYSIHEGSSQVYYTMPYVEGETLRQIIKGTKLREKKGETPHEIGVSVPELARIFLSVCQAVAYSHSKGVIHRDLKPENIMVGKFGEVFLLDWGIARDLSSEKEETVDLEDEKKDPNLTRPGKILGTVNYMAPERAEKAPASELTEIYSLGVILYQILTLTPPFQRKNLEHFKKIVSFERVLVPEEQAPYRDIPKQLSELCLKCLEKDPSKRCQSVSEIIHILKNYVEGRPEWILESNLDIFNQDHWEFQENILVSKHMAITRIIDIMEWLAYMISKNPFPGNLRLEFDLELPKQSQGVGILLCIPESYERNGLQEGFCIWLGSTLNPTATLFRSNAELISVPIEMASHDEPSRVVIEKVENSLKLYINGLIHINYVSHLPIVGTHLGFCYKTADFEISELKVFAGAQNAMVNCLSVPDTLLSSKNFPRAYEEYKTISKSFNGRTEGREALFRAGITLLERAKIEEDINEKKNFLSKAFAEFELLRSGPGAPLEYLGKSLIYYAEKETEEELKSLELALRKFAKHPLLPILKEHVIYRLHETSNTHRKEAYLFALMAFRLMPEIFSSAENEKFVKNLVKHWLELDFIDYTISFSDKKYEYLHLAVILAFFTEKPKSLCEIIHYIPDTVPEKKYILCNALFCLFNMGETALAFDLHKEYHHHLPSLGCNESKRILKQFELTQSTEPLQTRLESFFSSVNTPIKLDEFRTFTSLIKTSLPILKFEEINHFFDKMKQVELEASLRSKFQLLEIKFLTHFQKSDLLQVLYEKINLKVLQDFRNPLSFFYGCFLALSEGEEKALNFFKNLSLSYPKPHTLSIQYILNKISLESLKTKDLFPFELMTICEQLTYFYKSLNDKKNLEKLKSLKGY